MPPFGHPLEPCAGAPSSPVPGHADATLAGALLGPRGWEPASPDARGSGRGAILRCIARRPGMHKMAVARATGLAWGTITYHLDSLLAAGQVSAVASGKEVFLFPADVPTEHRGWICVLQCEHMDRLVPLVARSRELSVVEAMAALRLPRKPVQRLFAKLEAQGMVVRLGSGRPRYALTELWTVAERTGPRYGLEWAARTHASKLAVRTPNGPEIVSPFDGLLARLPATRTAAPRFGMA